MGPQLQLSTYTEEFSSPGKGKPARSRPSSAYRRNNPHPRPDFLLPRKLQTGYGPRQVFQMIAPPYNAPLFPPVRHISGQGPDGRHAQTQARRSSSETEPAVKQAASSSRACVLPPAGWLSKPQVADNPDREKQCQASVKNMQGTTELTNSLKQGAAGRLIDIQRFSSDLPNPAQALRRHSGIEPLRGSSIKRLDVIPSLRTLRPQGRYCKAPSKTTLDSSVGHSCFHVVKPFKAGHYIIHPEFVSECLQ